MKSIACMLALSRSTTIAGCADRNDCVTISTVVTPGSDSSTLPPSFTISMSYGAGSEAPAICPDWNSSTAAEFGLVGLMETSPPPVALVASPCCLSQYRSATSWVLPSEGVASDWPFSWVAPLMFDFTTTDAPPVAAPETILIAVPPDFCQALIAGLGPT